LQLRKKLQLREKVAIAFVRPNQLPPINSPENSLYKSKLQKIYDY
jgi:hypothetical protein